MINKTWDLWGEQWDCSISGMWLLTKVKGNCTLVLNSINHLWLHVASYTMCNNLKKKTAPLYMGHLLQLWNRTLLRLMWGRQQGPCKKCTLLFTDNASEQPLWVRLPEWKGLKARYNLHQRQVNQQGPSVRSPIKTQLQGTVMRIKLCHQPFEINNQKHINDNKIKWIYKCEIIDEDNVIKWSPITAPSGQRGDRD